VGSCFRGPDAFWYRIPLALVVLMKYTENGFLSDQEVAHWNARHPGDGDLLRQEPPEGTREHSAWFHLLASLEAEHDPTAASLIGRERNRGILRG
jgi:hypothetical protein